MRKPVNISTARKELPSLFDRVTRRRGETVVIRRRDGDEEAVLVSREYLESLELANRRLAPISEFRLVGSGDALGDVEEAIAQIRTADGSEAGSRRNQMVERNRR